MVQVLEISEKTFFNPCFPTFSNFIISFYWMRMFWLDICFAAQRLCQFSGRRLLLVLVGRPFEQNYDGDCRVLNASVGTH